MSANIPHDDQDDLPRPWERPGAVRRDCAPHRGPLLMALGRASVVCAALAACLWVPAFVGVGLGLATVLLADKDLRKMAAGDMDPAGRAQTARAWRWGNIGMLLAIFWAFVCPLLAGLWNPHFQAWLHPLLAGPWPHH